jgi:phosphate starvation-inducible PhoH-like protein
VTSKTLHFPSARHLSALYAGSDQNLTAAETALCVRLVSRDDWLKIEPALPPVATAAPTRGKSLPESPYPRPPAESVALAADFFNFLNAARGQGLAIRTPDFIRILETFARGEGAALKALYEAPLVIATNRKTIVPKTLGQKLYLQSILKNPVVFGIGPAGTGKTYLAMAAAVSALLKNEVQRIILTRPAVEAGEALGFLPGDLEEKILPYLRPLYDALHDMLDAADVTRLTEKGVIEIAPLAYMRGRTLSNAFIVLDEAQNTTPEQMMMFLTRLGEESRMVVTGDITQIDLPRSKQSGLLEVRRILQNIPGIEFHTFSGTDVVRHPLVLKIIEAYESYRNPIGTDDSAPEKR